MNTPNEGILKFHFSKYLEDDLNLEFYPYFLGSEKCSAQKPIEHHLEKDIYTFHFIMSGSGYLVKNGKTIKLKANDVFYFPPDVEGSNLKIGYYPDPNDPWEYIWFNLCGEGTEKLLKATKLTSENNYYTIKKPTLLRQELSEMINIAKSTTKRSSSYYFPYIMRFFAEISDERKIEFTQNLEKEKKVKIILDYIETNYTNPDISIKEIAKKMFYSIAYISRIFSETTNKTPVEYITSLRMLKALDMLRSGNYSISQISDAVGYSSPFYFSKKFKDYFGTPPSNYLK